MTRAGEVFDYFGGIGDLRAGILRFVGDPAMRIAEDYLRILRYFRFFTRCAGGPADSAALAAIRAGVPALPVCRSNACGVSWPESFPRPIRGQQWA